MNSFDSLVNQNLGWVHQNKYVLPVLSLFLGMYAALARPNLPKFVEKLFENPVFRLVVISYIIYRGNQDAQLSIMIAAAFLITIHMINKNKINDLTSTKPAPKSEGQNVTNKKSEKFAVTCFPGTCGAAVGSGGPTNTFEGFGSGTIEGFACPTGSCPIIGTGGTTIEGFACPPSCGGAQVGTGGSTR
jgi:hypothetical protein